MFNSIRQLFSSHLVEAGNAGVAAHAVPHYQMATAALLLEMTHADAQVLPEERAAVGVALQRAFSLSDEALEELVALAQSERDAATCLHEFTRSLNETLDRAAKITVVEALWQVAHADGNVDHYEEYLVRKVADLLHVSHRDFIAAKLRVADA